MKQFTFREEITIPPSRMADVARLKSFIIVKMDIAITTTDAYRLWERISESYAAGWLMFDFDNWTFTLEPKEFLLMYMKKFGSIL